MTNSLWSSPTSSTSIRDQQRSQKHSKTLERTKSTVKTDQHSIYSSTFLLNNTSDIVPSRSVPRGPDIDDAPVQICKLELQKQAIKRKLKTLRSGAVSALMEKDQHIQRLKQQIEEIQQQQIRKEKELDDKQYWLHLSLDEQYHRLKNIQCQKKLERDNFVSTITTKDKTICELGQQLETTKYEISNLLDSRNELSLRLSIVQQQTQVLNDDILRTRTDLCVLRESLKKPLIWDQKPLESETRDSLAINQIPTQQSIEYQESKICREIMKMKRRNYRQKQYNRREAQQLRLHYEMKLMRVQKKVSTVTEQLASHNERSVHISQADLKNEILLIDNYEQMMMDRGMKLELESQRSLRSQKSQRSQRSDRSCESQFSSRHFDYQPRLGDRDELSSLGSLKTRREVSNLQKITSKRSSHLTCLEDIEELYDDMNDKPGKDHSSMWKKVISGVIISVAVVGLFIKLRK